MDRENQRRDIRSFFGITGTQIGSASKDHGAARHLDRNDTEVVVADFPSSSSANNVPTSLDVSAQANSGHENQDALQDNMAAKKGKKRKRQHATQDHVVVQKGNKRKGQQWDAGRRTFQLDWVKKFPFIEPVYPENGEMPKVARCTVCSWKRGGDCTLQLKLDTIEKHTGKVYEKKVVDGKEENITRWKTTEECLHLKNVELYEKNVLYKEQSTGPTIASIAQQLVDKNQKLKLVQLQSVFDILKRGRPMVDYPKLKDLLSLQGIPNFPQSHWSRSSGWEFAKVLDQVIRDELREAIRECDFFAISLDEASANDHTAWVCMTIYHVKGHVRQADFVSVTRVESEPTAEKMFDVVKENLFSLLNLSTDDVARKLVCIGVDGASVNTGNRNGLCIKIQMTLAPYMLAIHCMAHRLNLAFHVVDNFDCVMKVEDLVKAANEFFCRSNKRYMQFKNIAKGLTKGRKMLKNVEIRWISLYSPVKRLFEEYPSLIALMDQLASKKSSEADKPIEMLARLTNMETLLTLVGILPMLAEMKKLIKFAQERTLYTEEYARARRVSCAALDGLYSSSIEVPYDKEKFHLWHKLVNIEGANSTSFLTYNDKDMICVKAGSRLVQMYSQKRRVRGRLPRHVPASRSSFDAIILTVRENLAKVAKALSKEIRDRFPRDELLESMAIVYPQFWDKRLGEQRVQAEFKRRLHVLIDHFCATKIVDGKEVFGALDETALLDQSQCFGETMWEQCLKIEKLSEFGVITKLWRTIGSSQLLREHMSEYFKLVDLCQTMVLGSVEDERTFSWMGWLKNKVRNRLTENLDLCLRGYACKYNVAEFPYDRALAIWSSLSCRRGRQDLQTNVKISESSGWNARS